MHPPCETKIVSENTHGLSRSNTYKIWAGMKSRCSNPKTINFARYGGRGIKVCERWHNFDNFLADMGERPFSDAQIDRKDNDKGYFKDNCTWSTRSQNRRNKSNCIMLTMDGETLPLITWAERLGIAYQTVKCRIRGMGWEAEKALKTPVNVSRTNKRYQK
jgi:hypothetical protein